MSTPTYEKKKKTKFAEERLKALNASAKMLMECFSKLQVSQQNSTNSRENSENKKKKDREESGGI